MVVLALAATAFADRRAYPGAACQSYTVDVEYNYQGRIYNTGSVSRTTICPVVREDFVGSSFNSATVYVTDNSASTNLTVTAYARRRYNGTTYYAFQSRSTSGTGVQALSYGTIGSGSYGSFAYAAYFYCELPPTTDIQIRGYEVFE